jgi:hypothetical protein
VDICREGGDSRAGSRRITGFAADSIPGRKGDSASYRLMEEMCARITPGVLEGNALTVRRHSGRIALVVL